jgi:hypothetical protein
MKLKPLAIEVKSKDGSDKTTTVELHCKHKADWPPAHATLDATPIELRQSGVIAEQKFQQLQTWQKVCGLMVMNADKCPKCPLALFEKKGHWAPFAPGGQPTTALPPFATAKRGRGRR